MKYSKCITPIMVQQSQGEKKANKPKPQKLSDYLYDQITVTFLELKIGIEKYFLPLRVLISSKNVTTVTCQLSFKISFLQKDTPSSGEFHLEIIAPRLSASFHTQHPGRQQTQKPSSINYHLICISCIIHERLISAPASRQEACWARSLFFSEPHTGSITPEPLCPVTEGFRAQN